MNSAGKKVIAKVAAVVTGSVFVLSATPATVSPVSAVALAESRAPHSACRHCYTETTMKKYFDDKMRPMVAEFFKAKYKTTPEPSHIYFIAENRRMPSACPSRTGNYFYAKAYAYCSTDQNIYLGQATMWDLYDKVDDIAPVIGLAHEWGHHIQHRKGIPELTAKNERVRHETQADCIAGAWMQYADQQGWLEPEDLQITDKLVKHLANAEGENGEHGTPEERKNAMSRGIRGGLNACNDFYRETPIITSQD